MQGGGGIILKQPAGAFKRLKSKAQDFKLDSVSDIGGWNKNSISKKNPPFLLSSNGKAEKKDKERGTGSHHCCVV